MRSSRRFVPLPWAKAPEETPPHLLTGRVPVISFTSKRAGCNERERNGYEW